MIQKRDKLCKLYKIRNIRQEMYSKLLVIDCNSESQQSRRSLQVIDILFMKFDMKNYLLFSYDDYRQYFSIIQA